MGYTTNFKGELKITPLPSEEIIESVNNISRIRHDDNKYPGIWCKWIINSNGNIEWDGGEKFYNYTEWLQYLIENVLAPQGYTLNGRISYRGERFEDMGVICVNDNIVRNVCGIYDVSDNEIIIAVTMNKSGETRIDVLV